MKRSIKLLTAALGSAALLSLLSPALDAQNRPAQYQQFVAVEAPVVALTNVKLIDGTGSPQVDGQTVVIEGDRITAVGPTGSVSIPSGAETLDLSGHTVSAEEVEPGIKVPSARCGGCLCRHRLRTLELRHSMLELNEPVIRFRRICAKGLRRQPDAGQEAGDQESPTFFQAVGLSHRLSPLYRCQ